MGAGPERARLHAQACTSCRTVLPIDVSPCPVCGQGGFVLTNHPPETEERSMPATKSAAARRTTPAAKSKDGHPPKRAAGKAKPAPKRAAVKSKAPAKAEAPAEEREIDVRLIDAGENARQEFDPDELEQLSASIKQHGLLQPVGVQPQDDGRYRLVFGERRWRACKLARLKAVRCRVLRVTDEEAVEIGMIENLRRKDLNAVEVARGYRMLLDHCGYTQASLARRFGLSQGQIANTVGLLKIPEAWQRRIITQEIGPTHARSIVPWVDHADVLDALEQELASYRNRFDSTVTVSVFESLVTRAAVACSRRMNQVAVFHDPAPKFKVTADLKAELDIKLVPETWGGPPVERAFNVALWDGRQREHEEAERERERLQRVKQRREEAADRVDEEFEGRTAQPRGGVQEDAGKWRDLAADDPSAAPAEPPEPPTPHPGALQIAWDEWRSCAIAERLEKPLAKKHQGLAVKLWVALVSASGMAAHYLLEDLGLQIAERVGRTGEPLPETAHGDWTLLTALDDATLAGWLQRGCRGVFAQGGELDSALLAAIAATLGIDAARDWEPSETFLNLLSEEQLRGLPCAQRTDPRFLNDLSKRGLVERLLEHWPQGAGIPALLQEPPART